MNFKLNGYLVLFLSIIFVSCSKTRLEPPISTTISEDFINPIGFYDSQPTFSWKLPPNEGVIKQNAYSIVAASQRDFLPDNADLWETGKISSDKTAYIKYGGKVLDSRKKIYWQVKYWDQSGRESEWSEPAYFELGLLNNSEWKGDWISFQYPELKGSTEFGTVIYNPQYLRNEFSTDKHIEKARLYITAKGVYEAEINGKKVGDDVMVPGWTPYDKRIETLTYDVTNYIKNGKNAIGIILAPGWHSGRIGYNKKLWIEKKPPRVLCQLEITSVDGSVEIIKTDDNWRSTIEGPIRFSSIYDGEIFDANYILNEWSKPDFDDTKWSGVVSEGIDSDVKLLPKRHAAPADMLKLQPVEITEPEEGKIVFDLGQNLVGVPKLKVPVMKDDTLIIRFAEMLNKDGTLYTENYRSAKSTDYYIASKDGIAEWQPKFTFHGFRFVELSNFDRSAEPNKEWVTGIVQYSDFESNGIFESSHEKLNKLQRNINWGLRGNFLDIPTDCPQRDERLGWTGDAQVFAPTSIFNADVHAFWASWLQSMREDQQPNGLIPIVIPNILGEAVSSGWGDAATVIPWQIYFRTGSTEILEENFDMMKKWVEYYGTQATDNIVDIHSFADWLQPYSTSGTRGDTPYKLISTAYYARSIELTLKAAQVLGYSEDAQKLSTLYQDVCASFEEYFFNEDGKIKDNKGTQTGYLLALGFGLLSEETAGKAIDHLLEKIKEADNHLRTGFLGTPLLAPVLDRIGRTDLAYEILFKETYPSWFYSINQGATTMWERWNSYSHSDGFGDAGMNSFNHYAYGAIGQWMYERIAGIRPLEAGYKKILIAPFPNEPLTSAEGKYDSPYGLIVSNWRIEKGEFIHEVQVPPNTAALIELPVKIDNEIFVNGKNINELDQLTVIDRSENITSLAAQPGKYEFRFDYKK